MKFLGEDEVEVDLPKNDELKEPCGVLKLGWFSTLFTLADVWNEGFHFPPECYRKCGVKERETSSPE
jgi:hypothetical protein